MNAKKYDQWYTTKETAELCIEIMKDRGCLCQNNLVIEPSAGTGVFVNLLRKQGYVVMAFDIEPKHPLVNTQDWLETDLKFDDRAVIIGNPPFGNKGRLAVDFINKSLEVANTVGFIVPLTLAESWTTQKHVKPDAMLIEQVRLPDKSFIFDGKNKSVKCVFQIWQNPKENLRLEKPETEHPDLEMRIYNKTAKAEHVLRGDWTLAVQRNCKNPKVTTNRKEVTPATHWILIKGPLEKLKKIDWKKINDNKMTAGIGKADVVKAYKEVA